MPVSNRASNGLSERGCPGRLGRRDHTRHGKINSSRHQQLRDNPYQAVASYEAGAEPRDMPPATPILAYAKDNDPEVQQGKVLA